MTPLVGARTFQAALVVAAAGASLLIGAVVIAAVSRGAAPGSTHVVPQKAHVPGGDAWVALFSAIGRHPLRLRLEGYA